MTHVTCKLTAKNRDQLWNPTLGNRIWATFTFTLLVNCTIVLLVAVTTLLVVISPKFVVVVAAVVFRPVVEVVTMGGHERIARRFFVLTQPEQLMNGERRPMLVEFARRRGGGGLRRSMVRPGREPGRSVGVRRAKDGPSAETKPRRPGVPHRRLDGCSVLSQTCHSVATSDI